jgi:hypothetical protein
MSEGDAASGRAYPCPVCLRPADTVRGCVSCGLPPDPQAARVVGLVAEIEGAQRDLDGAALAYRDALARRDALVAERNRLAAGVREHALRVRAPRPQATVPGAPPVAPAAVSEGPPAVPGGPPAGAATVSGGPPAGAATVPAGPFGPETTARTGQVVGYVLGGILLAAGAIVFTAVAWARYGVLGRALLLGAATAVVLAVPPLARWRRLPGVAETFAAIGLVMVVLDGYAAWYVDIADLSRRVHPSSYAAVVGAVVALLGVGYHRWLRLLAPALVGLLAAQPVLPLLVSGRNPGPAAMSLAFTAVASGDLLATWRSRRALAVPAGVLGVLAWVLALSSAAAALALAGAWPGALRGALALLAAAAFAVPGARRTRVAWLAQVAGGVLAVAAAIAAVRVADFAPAPAEDVLTAAVLLAVAVLAVLAPAGYRRGARIGAALAVAAQVAVLVPEIAEAAAGSVSRALPAWSAPLADSPAGQRWQTLVVLALAAAAVAVLWSWRRAADVAAVLVAVLAVLLPDVVWLRWWAPAVVEVAAAVLLAVFALAARSPSSAALRALPAAALGLHAVAAGLARPALTAVVAALLGGCGALLAALAVPAGPVRGTARYRTVLGAAGAVTTLLALPALAAAVAAAGGAAPSGVRWNAMVGLVLGSALLAGSAPRRPGYALPGLVTLYLAAGALFLASLLEAWLGVLSGVATVCLLVVAALLVRYVPGLPGGLRLAAPAGLLAVPAVVTGLAALAWVLLAPLTWLGGSHRWTGAPDGVGLVPAGGNWPEPRPWPIAPLTLLLLALAVAAVRVLPVVAPAPAAPGAAGWDTGPGTSGWDTGPGRSGSDTGPGTSGSGSTPGAGPVGLGPGAGPVRLRSGPWPGALAPAGPLVVVAGLTALAGAGARWPAVPGATLAAGLAAMLLAQWSRRPLPAVAVLAAAGTVAGLAGLAATEAATLAGLSVALVATVAGAVGGTRPVGRAAGWCAAVAAAALLAVAATQAASAGTGARVLAVLAVAAATLAASVLPTALLVRHPAEGRPGGERGVIEAAAHATAVVALLLSPDGRYAAWVLLTWAVALNVRALAARTWWPRTGAGLACALAGYWTLLAWAGVRTVEVYTLPAALVGLGAGIVASRMRPQLRSWTAYGPALVVAFAPSLVAVVTHPDQWGRRLGVFVAAVAVAAVGVALRLRAPLVVGAVAALTLAVHEVVDVWEYFPRWLPPTVGGLVLIALAATYERRLRDLRRMRDAVDRMH